MNRGTEKVILRESVSIPIMIIFYGVPAVLGILLVILIGLGIRCGMEIYHERKQSIEQLQNSDVPDSEQSPEV